MDTFYIVMPAHNEESNIGTTIKQWHPVCEKIHAEGNVAKLVIANDGSKDNTGKVLEELKAKYPYLEPLDKPNGGHGATVLYLYRYAIDNGADYIFQTDSDGQTNPDEFYDFWSNRTTYTGQFGNRTERGDGQQRAFVERVVCLLVRLFFHVQLPDANAPFRLMQTEALKRYIDIMPKDYNLPNIILTMCFVRFGEPVRFMPITFKPRQGGVNSINMKRIFKIGWQALRDFRTIKKNLK